MARIFGWSSCNACVAADKTVRAPGIGRSERARVSTRSNARKPTGAQTARARPEWRESSDGLLAMRALLRTRLSARRGLAAVSERGFQPAATPENPPAPKLPEPVLNGASLRMLFLQCVRCCGQDCPRAGDWPQ